VKQLALSLSSSPEPSFGNFVPGRNAEVLYALRAFAGGAGSDRFLYVWGGPGSGRSHLLCAVARSAREGSRAVAALKAPVAAHELADLHEDQTVVLDDADQLDASAQRALFALYNRIRDGGVGALLTSGGAPPAALHVRADLATRLAWGLVYEVHALSDEEKVAAMRAHALARGFELPVEVQDYVLRHSRRDLPSLLALVDRLDRYSLEQRRAITLPLAREVLKQAPPDSELS
jgi:DnaA-homolog protein